MYINNNKIRLDRISERLKEQEQKLENLLGKKELLLQVENEINNSIRDLKQIEKITDFVLDSDKTWNEK